MKDSKWKREGGVMHCVRKGRPYQIKISDTGVATLMWWSFGSIQNRLGKSKIFQRAFASVGKAMKFCKKLIASANLKWPTEKVRELVADRVRKHPRWTIRLERAVDIR